MTEAEWLACEDPAKMLQACRAVGGPSVREQRDYCMGCAALADHPERWLSYLELPGSSPVATLPMATRAAVLRDVVGNPWRPLDYEWRDGRLWVCVKRDESKPRFTREGRWRSVSWLTPTVRSLALAAREEATARKRYTCNNQGKHTHPATAWALAHAAFPKTNTMIPHHHHDEKCSFVIEPTGALDDDRLLILADSLEEAGCQDHDLLDHLRNGSLHVPGCHVLALLLGEDDSLTPS